MCVNFIEQIPNIFDFSGLTKGNNLSTKCGVVSVNIFRQGVNKLVKVCYQRVSEL
jgi:hypothetical protein